jgi:subfamily B ATP-binding cassette protein MsbA
VTFRYKPDEPAVIKSVSTTVDRGTMVAIVGPSGAGKSTLMALIARLYDPQQGRITVDGVDLRDLDMGSWRRRMSVVTQDIFIFNDTVANNIRFGRGDVALERVRAAADLAAAAEFIEQLPQGYDTILGDRGVRLSGGQQQRIAIARAIIADPDLLIFDEATSNLDTFTERAIQRAMEQMSQSRTVLVIAHRLSTIRRADKIIVLEAGAIVEEGSHRELLHRRGTYWEMVEHQRLDLVEGDAEAAMAEARA